MRPSTFDRSNVGRFVRLTAPIREGGRDLGLELVIQGPPRLLTKVFPEDEIALTVRPDATREDWERAVVDHAASQDDVRPLDPNEDLSRLLRPRRGPVTAPPATITKTVFVILRRTRPGGTLFIFGVPVLSVPIGASVAFFFPWAFATAGYSWPLLGNPNLFLTGGSVAGPLLSAGVAAGLLPDTVSFVTMPWTPFFPVFRVFGAGPGTSVLHFTAFSFGLP